MQGPSDVFVKVKIAGVVCMAATFTALVMGCASEASPEPPTSPASTPTPTPTARVVDHGSIRYASGDASEVAAGRYRYVVAKGDTLVGISQRFGADLCALATQSKGLLAVTTGTALNISRPGSYDYNAGCKF